MVIDCWFKYLNSADSSFKYIDANVASDIAYAVLTTCLFHCSNAVRNGNIYLIGNDGGEPQAIVGDGKSESADWSSDANTLMFWTSRDHELRVANFLDLRTGKPSAVVASVGMLGAHNSTFMVFDGKSQKWSPLGL